MNSDDLVRILAKKENIPIAKAKKLLKAFIDVVNGSLQKGEKVIFSNFGAFMTFNYPSKTVRDPRDRQKKLLILPTNVVKWHPSGSVKERLRGISAKDSDHKDNNLAEIEVEKSTTVIPQSTKTTEQNIPISIQTDSKTESTTEPKSPAVDYSNQVSSMENLSVANQKRLNKAEPNEASTKQNKELEIHIDTPASVTKQPSEPVQTNTPQPPISDSSNKISVDNAPIKPRISFEEFVRKSKQNDFLDPSEENINDKVDLGKAENNKIDHKIESNPTPISSISNAKINIEFAEISGKTIDKKILALVPEKIAHEFQVVPIADDGTNLTLAMIDPEDLETIELIKKQTGRDVIPKLTVASDLNQILNQYSGVESEVTEAITDSEDKLDDTDEDDKEVIKNEHIVEDAPVARIVQSLIKKAVREKASDIHIEPEEKELQVRFRIDGILQKIVTIPKNIQASVISRVKILAGIKIDESRLPQDGRIQLNVDDRSVDFRVSSMPTAFGEKIVMRILDKSSGVLSLEELGLRGRSFDIVENSIHKSHGMTLVTGPTGSGKTTTLYAIIDRLMDITVNIVTLEDPIEYRMPGINQSQVNAEIDYTFANGLRSILRQDPDVVMVGEIRDRDTAEMAVNAALTGHVVLSTLHTNDAAGAGPRMVDMGVEPFLITSSLNTIIGQRLTRKICQKCREETSIPDNELAEVKAEIAKMPKDYQKKWTNQKMVFYKGKGCQDCHNSGYKGRLGIFEVLDVNDKIQELLITRATASKITAAAIEDGMLTMKQDGIDKVLDGLTSIEEVLRVTRD